jgi:hypothetical protein
VAFGDGTIVRSVLGAVVGFLRDFASPTGSRGSILLMAGGLVVLGFLFLAFLFRSAIVGDLAPVANARAPIPRILLPPRPGADTAAPAPAKPRAGADFTAGRETGRGAALGIDSVFEVLRAQGSEARILESGALRKRVRIYACASCAAGVSSKRGGCDHERGILAGGFESLTGELAKVHETACVAAGADHCEFEVQHAPLRSVRA